jgi:hypothetical protein
MIEELKKDYMLKGISEPEYYLGGNMDPLDTTWKEDNVSLAPGPLCSYLCEECCGMV